MIVINGNGANLRNGENSSKKSFAGSASEKTSKLLLDKRQKAEARSRQQQLVKPQVFDAPVGGNGSHKLPTLPRNEKGDARNSSSLVHINANQSAPDFDSQGLTRPRSRTRGSMGQLRQAKPKNNGQLIQTNSLVDVKQKHLLQFPDVSTISAGQTNKVTTQYLHSSSSVNPNDSSNMLINDYHQHEKLQTKQQKLLSQSHMAHTQGFNKIHFKSTERGSKVSQQRLNEVEQQPSVKKQLMSSQNSAIRIVKRQNNKFNLMDEQSPPSYLAKYDHGSAEPHKVYSSQQQSHISQRKLAPQSALMQQLLASSTKKELKSQLSSTDKLFLNPHESSTCTSIKGGDSVFKTEQASSKRIRAEEEKIALTEIEVTNAQLAGQLTPHEVDLLLR